MIQIGTSHGQKLLVNVRLMGATNREHVAGRFSPGTGGESRVPEQTLKTDHIRVERKEFTFALRENARGRFLRITEDVSGRRDTIIVPAPGIEEFMHVLDRMAKAASEHSNPAE